MAGFRSDEACPREIAWLERALEACRGFPEHVRVRVGCELVSLRRIGPGASWETLRNVRGAATLTVRVPAQRSEQRQLVLPRLYGVISAMTLADSVVIVHAVAQDIRRSDARLAEKDLSFTRARLVDLALDRQDRRSATQARAPRLAAEDDVFAQLGFCATEARTLTKKAELVADIKLLLRRQPHSQVDHITTRALAECDVANLGEEALRAMLDSLTRREA